MFEAKGAARSIDTCVKMCCQRHSCHVAFKVDRYCYAVHCPTQEACATVDLKDSTISSDYFVLDKPQDINDSKRLILRV